MLFCSKKLFAPEVPKENSLPVSAHNLRPCDRDATSGGLPSDDSTFNDWLAGYFEAQGGFSVHARCITILLQDQVRMDTLLLIQRQNGGQIIDLSHPGSKKPAAVLLLSTRTEAVEFLTGLNGRYLSPGKYRELFFASEELGVVAEPAALPSMDTAWFAGLFDAVGAFRLASDGSVSIALAEGNTHALKIVADAWGGKMFRVEEGKTHSDTRLIDLQNGAGMRTLLAYLALHTRCKKVHDFLILFRGLAELDANGADAKTITKFGDNWQQTYNPKVKK